MGIGGCSRPRSWVLHTYLLFANRLQQLNSIHCCRRAELGCMRALVQARVRPRSLLPRILAKKAASAQIENMNGFLNFLLKYNRLVYILLGEQAVCVKEGVEGKE